MLDSKDEFRHRLKAWGMALKRDQRWPRQISYNQSIDLKDIADSDVWENIKKTPVDTKHWPL